MDNRKKNSKKSGNVVNTQSDQKGSEQKLSRQEVEHLAKLVGLQLNDQEIEQFSSQLAETISYIHNLDELDTSTVSETSHANSSVNVAFKDGTTSERTFLQSEALMNVRKLVKQKNDSKSESPDDGGFFIVNKILNK